MEMAASIETRPEMFSPDLGDDISRLVTMMAQRLAEHQELKEEMLVKAGELAFTLGMVAKNPISLSDEAIELTRKNLQWMNAYLDGNLTAFVLTAEQNCRLQEIYLDIAQALCEITIQQAERTKWQK